MFQIVAPPRIAWSVPAGQVSPPTSPGAGSVYDRHRILPVLASSAVSRPRTPYSPPVMPL